LKNNFIIIKNKVLTLVILLMIVLSSISLYITINEKNNSLDKELLYKKHKIQLVYLKYLEKLKLKYSNKIKIIQNDKKILELFAKRDRENLNKMVQPYFEELKKDEKNFELICFGLPNNKAFLRAHKPNFFGDDISKVQSVKKVNELKKEINGFMITKIGLYYRINTPVYYKDKYIGLISYGINIGYVNDYILKNFNSEVAILIDTKKYSNKKWFSKINNGEIDNYTIINSTSKFISENIKSISLDNSSTIKIKQKEYLIHKDNYIYDFNNNKIATIMLIQNITNEKKEFNKYIISLVLFSIILMTIIIFVLINSFNKMINKIISINDEVHSLNDSLEKKVAIRTKELEHQIEITKEATKAKSDFLANMSHEIRTPLNAILGFVSLLKENPKGKDSIRYIDIIDSSSYTLLGIINDILDLSKIENGKLEIDKIDFDTKNNFNTVAELFKAKAKEKDINFIVNISQNMPKYLHSDILRLKQIISNLLSNAIKFTPKNGIVELKIDYIDNRLNVNVKDNGIGISKKAQDKIFKAFSQEDASTTRKFGGTGLGLSISLALVDMLDGKLELKSQENMGSEFYFSIPISLGKEITNNDSTNNKNQKFNAHILLVEDNDANIMFMKIILKKLSLTFDIAKDGYEAIDKFKNNKFDLILMDENMPNMDGIEATQNILEIETNKNLKHTPIIALTANALKGDRERFLNVGMDEYLPKPIDRDKLNKILNDFL